jgi:uncharacterized protein
VLTPDQVELLCTASAERVGALRASLRQAGSALVAFSGGVDSAFVLKLAVEELGPRALALTALSASVAPEEEQEAQGLAASMGAGWISVRSGELANPAYARNDTNRCYHCKTELYDLCERERTARGLAVILDGFNADDTRDHRPGHVAAREHGVRSPLAEHGLTKAEIRAWSQRLGLPTWDKPQMACLASRIPYGTSVTEPRLLQVGRAESALRRLGLRTFRVRYHGEVARLEVDASEYALAVDPAFRKAANAALLAEGFKFVALDLEPFRSGRMNEAAGVVKASPPPSHALPVVG